MCSVVFGGMGGGVGKLKGVSELEAWGRGGLILFWLFLEHNGGVLDGEEYFYVFMHLLLALSRTHSNGIITASFMC